MKFIVPLRERVFEFGIQRRGVIPGSLSKPGPRSTHVSPYYRVIGNDLVRCYAYERSLIVVLGRAG